MSADLPNVDIVIADLKSMNAGYQVALTDARERLAALAADLEQERRENARLREQLRQATS